MGSGYELSTPEVLLDALQANRKLPSGDIIGDGAPEAPGPGTAARPVMLGLAAESCTSMTLPNWTS